MDAALELSRGKSLVGRDGFRRIMRALAQPVTYLGVVLLAIIYFTLSYLVVADRNEARESAKRQGANLVSIIDQSFTHVFKSIDASLQNLRKSYGQNPSNFDIVAWAYDPSVNNELTFDFLIVDAKGRVVKSSSSKETVGIDRRNEEAFLVQLAATTDELSSANPQS